MMVCLTPDYLDPLMSLIRSVTGVVIVYSPLDAWYVVTFRGTEIAAGRDLIRVVHDAWGVLRADAAVRGISPPRTELEQYQEMRDQALYHEYAKRLEANRLALSQYVLDQLK